MVALNYSIAIKYYVLYTIIYFTHTRGFSNLHVEWQLGEIVIGNPVSISLIAQ